MNIVPMLPSHLDEIAALEQRCFSVPWSRAMLAEELLNDYAHYFTAEDESGKVIGYGGLHIAYDTAYITNIATSPECRRQGIAGAILGKMKRRAAESGVGTVTLEVRESNEAARTLYSRNGFINIARRRDYYTEPAEDAIVMLLEMGKEA